jgi:hypothetical protein
MMNGKRAKNVHCMGRFSHHVMEYIKIVLSISYFFLLAFTAFLKDFPRLYVQVSKSFYSLYMRTLPKSVVFYDIIEGV